MRITRYVPRDGGMSFVDENDEVLVAGFGRSGHAVGDLPIWIVTLDSDLLRGFLVCLCFGSLEVFTGHD